MDINDIPVKSNRVPVTDTKYQLSAEEFNAMLSALKEVRNALSTEHQYNVVMNNNLSSNTIAVNAGKPCELKFTFISQERTGFNPWIETGETGDCKISIKNALYPEFTVIKNYSPLSSNVQVTFDVAEFLTSGTNQIVIQTTGDITGVTTPALIYTVTLTSLSVSVEGFAWWKANAADFIIPFTISGSISKWLVVTMKDRNGRVISTEDINIGTTVYVETAYNYTMVHPNDSGVYTIEAYVRNADGSIKTETISVNTICYTDSYNGKLVAINKIARELTNWAASTAFEYAIYDSNSVYTNADFVVTKDGIDVFRSEESSIETQVRISFVVPLEIETTDSSDFNVMIRMYDGSTAISSPIYIYVNNSLGYGAVGGTVMYINPRKRSNRQDNYLSLVNESTGESISPVWTNMNWSTDGWIVDEAGDNVLRLLANAHLDTKIAPLSVESNLIGKTIEIDYKISNVTDYENVIIDLADPHALGFVGMKIYPDSVKVQSAQNHEDDKQTIYVRDSARIRMTLVIMPKAYGNNGFNLCITYINGVRNKVFYYADNDYFQAFSTLKIGSNYADIDIYGIRVYNNALTSTAVQQNYMNWLETIAQKEDMNVQNDIYDAMGADIDFANTADQYNVFVFGNKVPNAVNKDDTEGTLEIYWAGHPEWNTVIDNTPCGGQGTSSMFYYRWNLRWKLPKTCKVSYADGSNTVGNINFLPGYPACKRLTAKKNFASSMQSHKIGSVNSMNDLAKYLGISNEANARITIYQRPFVGFEKEYNEEGNAVYTFIGLYTLGPDKGDDSTFGYDTDTYPDLLSIEGSDNSPLLALFRVPWNTSKNYINYSTVGEALQYNNENSWDYDAGKPDSKNEPDLVMAALVKNWLPAYNFVYECSPRLKPFVGTIDELNANKETYRNEPYEYWVTNGDVYYFEESEQMYIPSDTGNGTINLYAQLVDKGYGLVASDLDGKNAEDLNDLFVAARVKKFRQEMERYFDLKDAIFQRNWVEFNAATDNRAKNTYPYIFGNLSDGYKWRWRGDDMDTIFDITNQGEAKKGYWVEVFDEFDTGGAVWNGSTSNFWNLIELAFPNECIDEMRKFMSAMEVLGGGKTGTSHGNLMTFYQKYYFDVAQDYFPESLYNADARWTYDNALLARMNGSYTNDTNPMHQSLGDHFEAEKRWISKRILYMMSKYEYGDFSADGTDIIVVRAAGNTISYQITPAIDMYPIIRTGTSVRQGARTKAGEVCNIELTLSGTGDQQNAVLGASYLQDIGEWHDKNVTGDMIIKGKMLRRIKIGDATKDIVITIAGLQITDCVSLQELILTRVSTLGGSLDLSVCTHLKRVLAGGTAIANIILPNGGGLEYIEFSPYSQYITLKNFPMLEETGIVLDECIDKIMNFQVENCPKIDSVQLLVDIITAQAEQGNTHVLKRVRAVGFDSVYDSAYNLKVLQKLADGSYIGLDASGNDIQNSLPVLDGRIIINSNYPPTPVAILTTNFPSLELILNGMAVLEFNDDEFKRIALTLWDADKDGDITPEEGKQEKVLQNQFQGNTLITEVDFSELYFSLRYSYAQTFRGCTKLKTATFGDYGGFGAAMFYDCSSLEKVTMPDDLSNYVLGDQGNGTNWGSAFRGCTSLKRVDFLPKVNANPVAGATVNNCFRGCTSLEYIDVPEAFNLPFETDFNEFIRGCSNLRTAIFRPTTYSTFAQNCCAETNLLEHLVIFNPTPASVAWGGLPSNGTCIIYVPDESVNAYKTASGWSSHAARIKGISEYPGEL